MLRLLLLVILFLLSLLSVFQAPTYHLWLAAVAVTEFPIVFAGLTLLLLAAGYLTEKFRLWGTITGVAAFVLFLVPVVSAFSISKTLDSSLNKTFNLSGNFHFSFPKLFRRAEASHSHKSGGYVIYQNQSLKLDFYKADSTGKRPCVLVIHGGSWKSGDNKQLPELNHHLAEAGYHVAAINYRLAPRFNHPLPVQDVRSALDYLKTHATKLAIDSSRFVLLGRSAGAQIALLAAYTLNDKAVKGVIDFYGPADMVWGYSEPSNPLVMNSRKVMEDYLGGTYNAVPQSYESSSPINYVSERSVPTLIIHGKNDVLVAYEHSIRLQDKLNRYRVKNYFLSLPWATHGFDYNLNGPGGQLSTYAVKQFLEYATR